jgi:hypothetical protein
VKRKTQAPPEEVNLLGLVPVRNMKWETSEEGQVVLLRPKYRNAFLARLLLPRMKNPHYKIKLDDIGSYFWQNCDGARTIKEIAELQKKRFGEAVDPLYDRISLFLQTLQRSRFIVFKETNGQADPPAR